MNASQQTAPNTIPTGAPEADDLRARTMEVLDFPAIRERVAQHASFHPARRLALQMAPSYVGHEVEALQRETAEGLTFLDEAGDVGLGATEDASYAVGRAAKEGTLSGLELLAVADSLETQRRVRSAVLSVGRRTPLLAGLAEGIPDLRELERGVRAAIGPLGEVVDAATPGLGPLRRQVRVAYEQVTDALEGVLRSTAGRDALQDQVISIRGERLVVQVKTDMRNRIPGIVHDASNSGATLFVEPFATVGLCNTWRELVLEEARETQRVLRDLSQLVGAVAEDIKRGGGLTAQLDFILARARYSATLKGVAAMRSPGPEGPGDADGARVRLLKARHPLLGGDAVPVSVHVGPAWSALVITGPNTGGKTVAMKTVGLLALMNQSGLHVPAEQGSSLPVFDGVYADVGDQQSIQRSVSTFSSHMRSVIDILAQSTPESLVLLDELGTSTDPEEGSALAKAILGNLASRGVSAIVTTHHRAVAAYAEATEGMMNASVELDGDSLRPTYHLTLGVPGRSYAMSVASQLGLPQEIMDEALSLLEPQYLRFEDWLGELQKDRSQLQARLAEAEETQARTEETRRDLAAQLEDLTQRREDILHSIREELAASYDDVRKKLRRAEAALSWGASAGEVEEARVELDDSRQELRRLAPPAPPVAPDEPRRALAVGDIVDVRGLNVQGTVASVPEHGDEVDVAIGSVRFRLDARRLTLARRQEEPPEEEPARPAPGIGYDLGPLLASVELDLRGSRAQEALIQVEVFLDKALRDGMSSVRIIHGKGTGALRRAVRELLEDHPLAKSFATEAPERGGDGATVVELL